MNSDRHEVEDIFSLKIKRMPGCVFFVLSILKEKSGTFRIIMMCSNDASKMIWDSRRENQLQPVSFTNAFSIGEYLRLKEQLFLTS